MIDINEIRKADPEIADAMLLELKRQNSHIELIRAKYITAAANLWI